MFVIFCRSPLSRREPDEAYETEYAAAKAAGCAVCLIDYEALVNEGDATKAIKSVTSFDSSVEAVYRGWMMGPDSYAQLFEALLMSGVKLINNPIQFKHCHYLPEWLDGVGPFTPKTTVVSMNETSTVTREQISEAVTPFGKASIILKDFVKSEKHYWNEACFIPDASDIEHALKVSQRFLQLRGTNLEGGLIFRKFETFKKIGTHSKSKMPLTEEYRAFVLDGNIMSVMKYWDDADYPDLQPDLEAILNMVASVKSRFFTVDFARLESGNWMIVELGDGQVSGLPDNADVTHFYQRLAKVDH